MLLLTAHSLFFFLRFHLFLMGFDDRRCHMCWDDVVVVQFHREVAASARDGADLGGVASQLCHGDVGDDYRVATLSLSTLHASAAGVEITHHITHVRVGDCHAYFHDWLE